MANLILICYKKNFHYFCEYINSINAYIPFDIYLYDENEGFKILKQMIKGYNKTIFVQFIPENVFTEYEKKNIYILNTEQMSTENYKNKLINQKNIIDYAIANINIMNRKDILYFPYGINNKEIVNKKKENDICFLGFPIEKLIKSKRRYEIIKRLNEKGVKFDIVSGFGDKRDEKLFKYKIMFNIHHHEDYQIFESIRCDRCIFNKIIVITEKSLCDEQNLLKDKMIVCDYDNLVDKIIEVSNNYDFYYHKLFDDYDEFIKKYDETLKSIYKNEMEKMNI